jgi:hypothetical protein
MKKIIRQLSDTVTNYEYRLRKQAEALEQALLLDEKAQKFKEKAKDSSTNSSLVIRYFFGGRKGRARMRL